MGDRGFAAAGRPHDRHEPVLLHELHDLVHQGTATEERACVAETVRTESLVRVESGSIAVRFEPRQFLGAGRHAHCLDQLVDARQPCRTGADVLQQPSQPSPLRRLVHRRIHQFENCACQSDDVGGRVEMLATRTIVIRERDAEVGEVRVAGIVEQDVRRLDVAVHDTGAVSGAEGSANLADERDQVVIRPSPTAALALSGVPGPEQPHHEVRPALIAPRVDQRHDVWVLERRDRA